MKYPPRYDDMDRKIESKGQAGVCGAASTGYIVAATIFNSNHGGQLCATKYLTCTQLEKNTSICIYIFAGPTAQRRVRS